jgi:SAM-dependent methyltransferase
MSDLHAEDMSDHDRNDFFSVDYWDERYRSTDRVWSGAPNPHLVAYAAPLTPGTALDVGSGEGADAIWLACRGWHVTGLDISQVALDKAAVQAHAFGDEVAERLTWRQADLLTWRADATYDLVTAQFMHLPKAGIFDLHRELPASVASGGTLLVVGHHPMDPRHSTEGEGFPDIRYTAEEVAALLDPEEWSTIEALTIERDPSAGGPAGHAHDAVLRAVRR